MRSALRLRFEAPNVENLFLSQEKSLSKMCKTLIIEMRENRLNFVGPTRLVGAE